MDSNCLIWLYKRSPNSKFFPLAVLCSLQFVPSPAKTNQCHLDYFGGAAIDIYICRYRISSIAAQKANGKIVFQGGNTSGTPPTSPHKEIHVALCQSVPAERWFAIYTHKLRCWWQIGPKRQLWLKSLLHCMAELSVSARLWLARFPSLFIKSNMP